jgi:hypothetical protein
MDPPSTKPNSTGPDPLNAPPPLNYTSPEWAGVPPPFHWALEVLKNGVILETIPFIESKLVVGRLPDCDIELDHAVRVPRSVQNVQQRSSFCPWKIDSRDL